MSEINRIPSKNREAYIIQQNEAAEDKLADDRRNKNFGGLA
jgi:hypothetical protein